MAKISLRVYNREIEGLIEGAHLEESIAHCQHILKTFPMHVETYKLLGKAFLEGRQFTEASDIFQRILMAVPDDFISHVGMSIIRDDEGKLDESIWHMERAFEVQPSNSAIQGELRRLYGKRDGVEPTKIRLSRDALANMYSQGELFNQAIAEIRSVLAGDPNRPDLQVMLARAYFFAGKKVEAADMAAMLLKKFPYCLDGLRVLVEILSDSENAEKVQSYRQRLRLLDPYSAFVTGNLFESDKVSDAAVTIDRLDYDPHSIPAGSQPSWASSLGIKLEDGKKEEPPAGWMADLEAAKSEGNGELPSKTPAFTEETQKSIPDWMRNGNLADSAENDFVPHDEVEGEPLAQADIPDWLKSKIPDGIEKEISSETVGKMTPSKEDSPLPGWISEESVNDQETAHPEPSPFQKESVSITSTPGVNEEVNQPFNMGQAVEDTFQKENLEEKAESVENALGWMKDLPDQQEGNQEKAEEPGEEKLNDIPDWVKSSESLSREEQETKEKHPEESVVSKPDIGETPQQKNEEDDTLSWLRHLGEKQDVDLINQQAINNDEMEPVPDDKDSSIAPEDKGKGTDLSWLTELVNEVPPTSNQQVVPDELDQNHSERSSDWVESASASDKKEEPLPDWLQDQEQHSASEKPGDFLMEKEFEKDEKSSWFDESAPVAEEVIPTGPTEWLNVEKAEPSNDESKGKDELLPEGLPERLAEKRVEFKGERLSIKSPPVEKDAEILKNAQSAMQINSLVTALGEYGKLIKRGHLLDEVIHDLREGTNHHPVDVIVWQSLGDAYMRANRLQEALDAYTKAEELLR